LIDLTVSNPTHVGIRYPDALLGPLASSEALAYNPSPLGMENARRAIADTYVRRGLAVDPRQVVLTASTSEAYSLLFKLLCDPPGDVVLRPVPSYPLFDHLASLDGVRQVRYPLEYHGRWSVDAGELDRGWGDRVRAVLAVTPNNPTGSFLSDVDAAALIDRCAAREAALILDEVFVDYP